MLSNSTLALSASNGGMLSAAGEALQILPAMVPIFCICFPPTSLAASLRQSNNSGKSPLIMSDQVAIAQCGNRLLVPQ